MFVDNHSGGRGEEKGGRTKGGRGRKEEEEGEVGFILPLCLPPFLLCTYLLRSMRRRGREGQADDEC